MVELPNQLCRADGDAVGVYPWWMPFSLSSVQKPECRRRAKVSPWLGEFKVGGSLASYETPARPTILSQ